jgi:hypothetical protein
MFPCWFWTKPPPWWTPDNEVLIQEAVSELITGRTVLVVAHRLTTIRGAARSKGDDGVETGGARARYSSTR